MERIRLLLVDDHVLFRQSLKRLLASEADFEIVADCGTAAEALEVLPRETVDIVLLDFDLGHDHGSQFIAASRRAGWTNKILMVTAGMTAAESATALHLGASGIFLKQGSPSALVQAIRLVAGGAMWVDQHIIQQMAAQVNEQEAGDGLTEKPHLTEREHDVLQGVFEGLANKEIGARLQISESAVKATLQQLFRKTHVRTRGQLVRVALEGSFATTRKS
jgi:two-component system nitrate/nitrite response regulator NarL